MGRENQAVIIFYCMYKLIISSFQLRRQDSQSPIFWDSMYCTQSHLLSLTITDVILSSEFPNENQGSITGHLTPSLMFVNALQTSTMKICTARLPESSPTYAELHSMLLSGHGLASTYNDFDAVIGFISRTRSV